MERLVDGVVASILRDEGVATDGLAARCPHRGTFDGEIVQIVEAPLVEADTQPVDEVGDGHSVIDPASWSVRVVVLVVLVIEVPSLNPLAGQTLM